MKKMIKLFTITFLLIFLTGISITAQQNYWNQLNSTINGYVYSITITPHGKIFVGTSKGVYLSADSGKTWTYIVTGLPANPSVGALATDDKDNVYAGVWGKGIFRLNNNDTEWISKNSGLLDKSITAIAYDPVDTILFAGTYNSGSFYLQGNDTVWVKMDTSLSDSHIDCFLVDTAKKELFTGTWSGVFRSTDAGKTWGRMGTTTSFIINTMAVNSKGYIFAGCSNYGVFCSKDSGATWVSKDVNPADSIVSNIIINSNDVIFKSSLFGVSYSTDDGDSWVSVDGIRSIVSYLYIDVDNYLYAGTENGTMYRSKISTITDVIESKSGVPGTFMLSQNYPNPFNPQTIIEFELNNYSFVTLKVYDCLGKEISTLANGYYKPGNYKAKFNALNLSSGVYFYRLTTGSFSAVKKMVVLK
jgi:photosystem II stability/assembly factor-like uncharacterized protein